MEKNDILITILPTKPLKKVRIGANIAPVYLDILSKKLNAKSCLSLNMLSSFDSYDYDEEAHFQWMKNNEIEFDYIYRDNELKHRTIDYLEILDKKNYLKEETKPVLRCKCNKIDMVKDVLLSNSYNTLYEKNGEVITCKECGEVCEEFLEKGLYLEIKNYDIDKLKVLPEHYKINIVQMYEYFCNKQVLISKKRDTGVVYKCYSIDIDFVINNFLNDFQEKSRIIVVSNKHLIRAFFIGFLEQILNSEKETIFLFHPYVYKTDFDINENFNKYDANYRKLILYYTSRWGQAFTYFDKGLFDAIAKLRGEKRTKLYEYITKEEPYDDLYQFLNKLIHKNNLQTDVKAILDDKK